MFKIPLSWITKDNIKILSRNGVIIEPIAGYHETNGFRAYQLFFENRDQLTSILFHKIYDISDSFELTAEYVYYVEQLNSTTGSQMFAKLSDFQKILSLSFKSWHVETIKTITEYFLINDRYISAESQLKSLNLKSFFDSILLRSTSIDDN